MPEVCVNFNKEIINVLHGIVEPYGQQFEERNRENPPDVKWGARLRDFVKTDTMTFAANIHSKKIAMGG